jgi:hypothetical protein
MARPTAHGFLSPLPLIALTVPLHHLLFDHPWFPFTTGALDLNGAPALPLALTPTVFLHSYFLSPPVLILYMRSYVQFT